MMKDAKLLANLGDADPVSYGGFFVFELSDGSFEIEVLEEPEDDEDDPDARWTVRRFSPDRCTYENGVLSDNPYNPKLEAWYNPKLEAWFAPVGPVAASIDVTESEMIANLCSEDPVARAWAYQALYLYHGGDNFDSYPLYLTQKEVEERFARIPGIL